MKEKEDTSPGPVKHGGAEGIQTAYRELLDRHNRLLRNLPCAFFEINGSRIISFMNEQVARVTGYRSGELLNKDFAVLLQSYERHIFEGLLTSVLRGAEPDPVEISLVMKDGSINYFELTAVPILHGGKITGMGVVARDLEEVKKIRDQLDEVKQQAAETSEKLKENIKELEEFALISLRRELKMTEIRELLARYTEKVADNAAPRPPGRKDAEKDAEKG